MRTRSSRLLTPFILALFSFAFFACFEIEQSIELEEDMSGTADLKMAVDFEPVILIMATMQKQMEGKEGPPTEEELAKARAEFKAQNEAEDGDDLPSIEEANRELPEGIELTDMDMVEGETSVKTSFSFSFDHLRKLIGLQLPSKEKAESEDPGALESPFENLELVEGANTFTIRTRPENPADSVEQQVQDQGAPSDPAMEKMMKEAFRNLRFVWKVTAPFEVVSHNATRVEGNTLIWEYDMERFEMMESSGSPDEIGIEVTYRR
ncbi:MAG: hypothetical protein R3338_08035 [Thermoanaerobaculia bacterium]|nr:hypothetical protein [Thermoanaerobaculia bacterium]